LATVRLGKVKDLASSLGLAKEGGTEETEIQAVESAGCTDGNLALEDPGAI